MSCHSENVKELWSWFVRCLRWLKVRKCQRRWGLGLVLGVGPEVCYGLKWGRTDAQKPKTSQKQENMARKPSIIELMIKRG